MIVKGEQYTDDKYFHITVCTEVIEHMLVYSFTKLYKLLLQNVNFLNYNY